MKTLEKIFVTGGLIIGFSLIGLGVNRYKPVKIGEVLSISLTSFGGLISITYSLGTIGRYMIKRDDEEFFNDYHNRSQEDNF